MNQPLPPSVAIIGGGPAGMMAAISAANAGARATLYERQPRLGRKLAATGGGRCNITNSLDPETLRQRFGPRGRFISPALRLFGRDDLLAHMKLWGVPCASEDGFHYFPVSQRATDVVHALETQMKRRGVRTHMPAGVSALEIADGRVRGIRVDGRLLPADAVILAAGGAAWPALGGCRLGYELAAQAGHATAEPAAALVGLKTGESWPRSCAGVTLPAAEAFIDLPGERKPITRGILLFTHDGVSGPLVLDISGHVTPLLRNRPDVPLRVNLSPAIPREEWRRRIEEWRTLRGKKSVRNLLDECLPHSLAGALAALCEMGPDQRAAQMTAAARDRLLENLTAAPLTVTGSEGLERAMVTRGGVDLKPVNPTTLESRLVSGLYFAGEVLDLDGPCGGYNLQWAFSSGWLAGLSAARRETRT
ncbi:MAG: NAD(P)/FAD-dependent oxidoreductase [Kiritimatiellia bacterium]